MESFAVVVISPHLCAHKSQIIDPKDTLPAQRQRNSLQTVRQIGQLGQPASQAAMIYKSRDRSCCCCCCRLGYPLKLATRHTICNSARKMRFEYRNYCQISTIYNLRSLIEAHYNWLVLRSHFACRSCFAHIWRSDNFRHRSCADAIARGGSFHCKMISQRVLSEIEEVFSRCWDL